MPRIPGQRRQAGRSQPGRDHPRSLQPGSAAQPRSPAGPVVHPSGPRGAFSYSNGGYALLGQLIADVTGGTYPEAATRLVLGPLGMSGPSFPATWPATSAVTGYRLAGDGSFEPAPATVCTLPAAGGLWATAADLVRFGLSWASLLPAALAGEALRPQVARDSTGRRWAWAGCLTSLRMSAGTLEEALAPARR